MKLHNYRTRALERLYRKVIRLIDEDGKQFDSDPDFDFEKRAKDFVASMSGSTKTHLVYHIQERHGLAAFEDFSWLMPAMESAVFNLEIAFRRAA